MNIENKNTLHFSKIRLVTERVGADNKPVPFSFVYVAQNGDIVRGEDAVTTSVDVVQHTRTVDFYDVRKQERVTRTLCDCLFMQVDKVEIVAN